MMLKIFSGKWFLLQFIQVTLKSDIKDHVGVILENKNYLSSSS